MASSQADESFVSNPKQSQANFGSVRRTLTILILGETGVGKSTLINALANYLIYEDLFTIGPDDALTLIPTSFFLYEPGELSKPIEINATTNEEHTTGQSSTQHPRTYVFYARLINGEPVQVKLIDTPGMGDTRGVEQDKKNMDLIINYLANYPAINGILMLMKPNNSRLTTCTLYRPGDTMPALKSLLDEIKRDSRVSIPITNTNVFMVDNEAYRFLLARGKVRFTQEEVDDFRSSWMRSSKTCRNMLNTIAGIPCQSTDKTVILYEVRQVVLELCKPLAEVAAMISANKKAINDQITALDSNQQSITDLQKALTITKKVPHRKELPYPMTVCTHEDCVEYVQGEDGIAMPNYVTECHAHCYLTQIKVKAVGDPQLAQCAAMENNVCIKCHHEFTIHMHITYKLEEQSVQVINQSYQQQIASEQDNGRKMQMTLSALRSTVRELEDEEKKIMSISARFAVFVKENGIVLYNDALLDYIDHLIKDARDAGAKIPGAGAIQQTRIDSLEKLKLVYESEK
ncbi:uncharacterized protein BJ171DRAFT_640357, partial [Polychytrium aggregatum]|uniref:uncharacterized protein n=1 Tax=Polychytrium aggregatum TaxID=110093 RepID=UPI0022FE49E0